MNTTYTVIKKNSSQNVGQGIVIGTMSANEVKNVTKGYKRQADESGIITYTRKNSRWVYEVVEVETTEKKQFIADYIQLNKGKGKGTITALSFTMSVDINELIYCLTDMITKSVIRTMYEHICTNNVLKIKQSVYLWCSMGRHTPYDDTMPQGADIWNECYKQLIECCDITIIGDGESKIHDVDTITYEQIQAVRRNLRSYIDKPVQAELKKVVSLDYSTNDSEIMQYGYYTTIEKCTTALARSYGFVDVESIKRVEIMVTQLKEVLTPRQFQFFRLRCDNLTNKAIAEKMNVSERRVEQYADSVRESFYKIEAVENYSAIIPSQQNNDVSRSEKVGIVSVDGTGNVATWDSIKGFSDKTGITRKTVYKMLHTGKEYHGYTVMLQTKQQPKKTTPPTNLDNDNNRINALRQLHYELSCIDRELLIADNQLMFDRWERGIDYHYTDYFINFLHWYPDNL